MKKFFSGIKRILALLIVFGMVTGLVPVAALEGFGTVTASAAEVTSSQELNNGYLKVTVSNKTAGFGIRTVAGDKVNKSDNDKYLVFEYDEDNTSFTSFQVTRNGKTKEYIFGGKYWGSSGLSVTKSGDEVIATWSVDDLTFTQSIVLVNTGSTEHGSAQISYSVKNNGDPAQVKCRILMDTALGYQDYAYYKVGADYLERETTLGQGGYDKSFYAVDRPEDPRIIAYTINASVDTRECVPYQTILGHWNNLASTVFDYTPDVTMTFTNYSNKKYLTSDSAYALYFDMGEVASGASASAATNYGVYSNESMEENDTIAVNVNAPDVIQYAVNADGSENRSAYENGGAFNVKTHIKNIAARDYSDIRIVVTAAGCIEPLDQKGNPTNSTIDKPYSIKVTDVGAGEQLDIDWNFRAEPQESGQYGRIQYKVYDVSDDATMGTGQIMQENLLGEGYSYILCPGSVSKIPQLKFTGSSPNTIFSSGIRNFNITGENFSMLLDKSAYSLKVTRVDGKKVNGIEGFTIPASQFQIDDSSNVISVVFNEENPGTLPEGMYQLTLDYVDASKQDVSGRALQFHVSNEEKYRNEAYGFLAVLKSDDLQYSIQKFANEEIYWDWLEGGGADRESVLLEFQGNFISQKTTDGSIAFKGISNNKNHNVMTLNGALDIRSGTCTVTEKDGSVTVDFDADIYTTGSGTYVHTGVAALTELEAGGEYNLIPYDENGERGDVAGETIALLWPSVGQAFQNLMGLLFNLKYGELGVIAHEGAPTNQGSQTRLVAFGAAMDLSFLIPASTDKQYILDRAGKTKDALGSSWDAAEHNSVSFSADEIRALNRQADYRSATVNTNATPEDVDAGRFADVTVDDTPGFNMASVAIDDILFGGEYLGVNMELALGIPPYIMNMPALECVLSIHTVGDWSFGVDGQCHFVSFDLQAGLQILSHDGAPIVDSMSFFLGGITPGFNIDGLGVLWLQGAHGGIENIYDTIFLSEKIPPLKLIIGTQFSVMQIFSAYATMGLSMRGVELVLSNGQFSEFVDESTGQVTQPQPITIDGSVKLDWYPEFYFHAAVNLALAMTIRGSGYIVGEQSGFYEFFIRGSVSVPSDIPIIGGYEVAGLGMGVNTEKIWGKINYLGAVTIGLTYYWGGDIDWSGSSATPTYPELLGDNAGAAAMILPVDYNEETNETLFMALGTNMRMSAATTGFGARDVAPGINDLLHSDIANGGNHTMKLEKNRSGKVLSIQWTSDDETAARAAAAAVTIIANDNTENQIPIKIWQKENAEGANANFSYDPETDTAYLSVIFAADDAVVYGTTWDITTESGAQLVVYDVLPLPEVTIENAELQGNVITLELGGHEKETFTDLTVIAEGKESGQVYLLGGAEDPFADGASTLTLTMPDQAVSDTYSIQLVCKDEAEEHYHEESVEIAYTNTLQPNAPTAVSAANAGDYKVAVSVSASGDYDGYQFTAYDSEGKTVSGMSGILMNKDGSLVSYDDDGKILDAESTTAAGSYVIGGQFAQTVMNEDGNDTSVTTGLTADEHTIEVRAWKKTANGAVLLSEPTSTTVVVREPVKTQITVRASTADGSFSATKTVAAGTAGSHQLTTFASADVLFQLSSASEAFTGTWRVDGGLWEKNRGEIAQPVNTVNLTVTGLDEGQHVFTFQGKNQYGDAVSLRYPFEVDTLGPRMLLDAPVNGSLFEYRTGDLEISGVTDSNVSIAVTDNTTGQTVLEKTALQTAQNGQFSQSVTLDRTVLNHDLTITLTDKLGNETSKDVSVMSNGLGSIEKLMLYAGAEDVTNTKLTAGGTYNLQLMAKLATPDNAEDSLVVLLNADGMVDWTQDIMEGTSELTDTTDGVQVTTSSDAEVMVTARFLVSDQGDYSVSAAFGYTGNQIQSLDSEYTQIVTTDQLYTGKPRSTDVEVWYRGTQLVEGTDYTIGEYSNNVEVSTEDAKAQVKILGIGSYASTAIGEFTISYLELDESWITVSGQMGTNNYYISDVSIIAADDYIFVTDDGSVDQITLTGDGEQSATFRICRESDGAMTDLVTRTASIDKTAPTGTITLDETTWSKFLQTVTFGFFKVNSLAATVTAEDASGISKIEYVVSETVYSSASELEAAGVSWSSYSDLLKPTIQENTDQIIYVRITDKAGNVSYLCSDGIHMDTVAPEVSVAITGTTSSSVSFNITSSEAGTYYYTVLKAAQEIPTVEQVKSGNSGTITADKAGQPVAVTAGGLVQNVAYVIYVVTEDTVFMLSSGEYAPNTSKIAVSNPVTTDRLSLNDDAIAVQVQVEDALYTGSEVKPAVKVFYDDKELVAGVDYEFAYYENVEVSADAPYVQITGINDYVGILKAGFDISYLPLEESWITVDGVADINDYYVSDVSILPADGYEFVVDGQTAQIRWTSDGDYSQTFRVRRISDGALTDLVTRTASIDKTAPTGTITLDETTWSKFLETVTFGFFKVNSLAATVTAEDASGISKIEYVISETAYSSASELEAAGMSWSSYSDLLKPTIQENADQIVYVRITDQAGNVSYLSTDGIHVDTLAPQVAVEIISTTTSGLTFQITSNEAGKYYYAVQKASATAPSAEQVMAQNVTDAAVGTGNISAEQAGQPITLSVSDLKIDTAYVVYVVAEDSVVQLSDGSAAANASGLIASEPVKTSRFVLTEDTVQITVENALYTGSEVKPAVQVSYKDTLLTEGVDYQVTYHENVEVSSDKPYVQITGLGDYSGSPTKSFAIDYLTVENGYSITGTSGDNGYYVKPAQVTPAVGYELIAVDDSQLSFTEDGTYETKFRIRRTRDGALTDIVTLQLQVDQTAPTGSVTVAANVWNELLSTITFGLLFNETLEATITAEDAFSGMASIEYVVSETSLSIDDLPQQTWTPYTKPVVLDADGTYVVYGKLMDKAGNTAYIGSDGLIIDTIAPGISGIVDGGVYATEVSFTLDSDTVSVTVDGKEVFEADGSKITLTASEDPQKIVVTDRAGNVTELTVTVYPPRVVTFRADGKTVSTIEVDYGTDIAADQFPRIPAKTGYDVTAPYWDHDGKNITADTVITAVYTANQYTVTTPGDQIGYSLSVDAAEVSWHEDATLTFTLAPGYSKTDAFAVLVNGEKVALDANGKYVVSNVEGNVNITVEGVADVTAPTAEIKVATNIWTSFLNSITFDHFFKETQKVTITAADVNTGSGIDKVYYYLSDSQLTLDEMKAVTWSAYTGAFNIDPENKYVIYALAVDHAGNAVYISSDGLVLDATAPAVTGMENGGVYYGNATFRINDDHFADVTVDGKTVKLTDGAYTIAADNAKHTIVATDKAGNVTSYTITVYKIYKVTFVVDGKTVATVPVNHGHNVETMPQIPAKAGYDLTAPYWDHNGKNITADTTITAVYTLNKYTVTFVADGKTVETQSVEYGKDAALPKVPAKVGHDQTEPYWDHDGKNITADTTITAVYNINKYTVIYVAGDRIISTQTITHGGNTVVPEVPAKAGYTAEWDKDGKNITADTTITAVYSLIADPSVPKTGDNNQVMLWASIVLLSLCAVVVLTVSSKRYDYKGKYKK